MCVCVYWGGSSTHTTRVPPAQSCSDLWRETDDPSHALALAYIVQNFVRLLKNPRVRFPTRNPNIDALAASVPTALPRRDHVPHVEPCLIIPPERQRCIVKRPICFTHLVRVVGMLRRWYKPGPNAGVRASKPSAGHVRRRSDVDHTLGSTTASRHESSDGTKSGNQLNAWTIQVPDNTAPTSQDNKVDRSIPERSQLRLAQRPRHALDRGRPNTRHDVRQSGPLTGQALLSASCPFCHIEYEP